MSNLDSTAKLKLIISNLKEIIETDVSTFYVMNNDGELYPPSMYCHYWREIYVPLIKEIIRKFEYISRVTNNSYVEEVFEKYSHLNNLTILYIEAMKDSTKLIDLERIYNELDSTSKFFDDELPDFKFVYTPDLKKEDFFSIYQETLDKYPSFDLDNQVPQIFENANENRKKEIFKSIINMRNIAKGKSLNFHDAMNFQNNVNIIFKDQESTELKELRKKIESDRVEYLNEVEISKQKALEEVEKAKSGMIITAFKNRSVKHKDFIGILYFIISLLFIIIISSFIFRLNIHTDDEFNLGSFIYFLSYIIAISGLLTFVIKEKNRLVDQSDHFERCHTELEALTTYVVGLDATKVEDLKKELAHKYFTGGSSNQNQDRIDANIPNENIKQLIDLLNTFQKK